MIYIKGINPTTNHTVYFRGYFSSTGILWTENFNQKYHFSKLSDATTTLNNLINLNIAITNLEIVS